MAKTFFAKKAEKSETKGRRFRDRFKPRVRDIWHATVCKKTVDQVKKNLPKYSRRFVRDRSSDGDDSTSVFDAEDEIDLDKIFGDYLKTTLEALLSETPLRVTKLSSADETIQICRQKSKVVFKKLVPKLREESLKLEGRNFEIFKYRENSLKDKESGQIVTEEFEIFNLKNLLKIS
jgi:hypothetical protein